MCKLLHILFVLRFNKQDKSFLKKKRRNPALWDYTIFFNVL